MGFYSWMATNTARIECRWCFARLSEGKYRDAIENAKKYVRNALQLPDSALPEDCEEVRLLALLATFTEEQAKELQLRMAQQERSGT